MLCLAEVMRGKMTNLTSTDQHCSGAITLVRLTYAFVPREIIKLNFRKRREKSAMILVSIVLTFLVCHTFRLVIQAYEVTHPSHSTAEHHGFCHAQGRSVSTKVTLA